MHGQIIYIFKRLKHLSVKATKWVAGPTNIEKQEKMGTLLYYTPSGIG